MNSIWQLRASPNLGKSKSQQIAVGSILEIEYECLHHLFAVLQTNAVIQLLLNPIGFMDNQ